MCSLFEKYRNEDKELPGVFGCLTKHKLRKITTNLEGFRWSADLMNRARYVLWSFLKTVVTEAHRSASDSKVKPSDVTNALARCSRSLV